MDFDTVVMKFGGSSVADPDKIRHVARRLVDAKQRGLRVVGTVSAMGKTTDGLIDLAHQVSPTPNVREFDMLLSTGERIACALVAMAIHDLGQEAVSLTGSQAGILTDAAHMKAKIREIRGDRVKDALDQGKIVLVAGFQGFSRDTMEITTLGRGGTDATAVALAAALGAACEIYSDVPGVFTADPRIVPNARKLPTISYEEMLEMSASGAKVLMLRSVELARNHGVRIHARSTFSDEEGTWVQEGASMEQPIVSAVTHSENDVVFTLSDIPDRPGVAALIFDVVASRARERRHDHPERRPRERARCRSRCRRGRRPRPRRALDEHARRARRVHGRGEPRPRQGVPDRRRHALASRRRGEDVPHARRQRDQPADDLDLADQDLLHDRPLGDPERRPRAARGVRARERARCTSRRRTGAGRLCAARRRITRAMEISHRATQALITGAIGIVVVIAVRFALDFVYDRYERRLARRDPMAVARRRTTFSFLRRVIVAIVAAIAIWTSSSLYDVDVPDRRRRCSPRAPSSRSSPASPSARRSRTSARACSLRSRSRCASATASRSASETGFVEEMNLIYTTLVTDDARRIFVPNTQLTTGTIVNRTIKDPRRLVAARFPVSIETPIDEARWHSCGAIAEIAGHARRATRASASARSATAPSGSTRRPTRRSTPTSSSSRASCASAASARLRERGFLASSNGAPGRFRDGRPGCLPVGGHRLVLRETALRAVSPRWAGAASGAVTRQVEQRVERRRRCTPPANGPT